jgi:SAM-dependent methyltransferase
MWMSFGGMIGGIAAGLIAPYVFNWIAEYPILIALTLLCRWSIVRQEMETDRYVQYGIVAVAVLVTVFGNFVLGALLAATALFWQRPLPVAAVVAFLLMGNQIIVQLRGDTTFMRSFFGVHKISESEGGYFRLLTHGTTIHGVQGLLDDDGKPLTGRPKPAGYYYEGSAIAQAIRAVQGRSSGPVRFGLIGLGTGSIACLARPDDPVRYYEIDPVVVEIAKDPTLFTFLSQCRPNVPIVLGDARLTFSEAEEASYDMIIVDAFSSDAIPIHLLTREAMAIYLKKLAPGGVVLMHVSNRHLELASVVANVANVHGMVTRVNTGEEERDEDEYEFGGTVVAAARNEADFGALLKAEHWRELKPDRRQRVWTDDYSNIIGALVRSMAQ